MKPDEGLLDTLVYITELPTPILGTFDEKYLELPQEILVTVMRHHQKYFSVEREDGKLAPNFIAVMNTDADPDGLVRQGNERVLRARFNDARFFWEVDQKKKLEDRLDDLANVTFQAKLGSYLEKTNRVVELVPRCSDPAVERAALLSKVRPHHRHGEGVHRSAGHHRRPVRQGARRTRSQSGAPSTITTSRSAWRTRSLARTRARLLAYADKWDTLVSCFRVGLIPTGSKDPFALRRAAQGVVRILVEGKLDIRSGSGSPAIRCTNSCAIASNITSAKCAASNTTKFGPAWPPAGMILTDLEARLLRVQAVRSTPDFEPLAASFKRIKNILTQANFTGGGQIDPALLEPGPEQDLYDANTPDSSGEPLESRIASLRPKVDALLRQGAGQRQGRSGPAEPADFTA